MKQKKLLKKVKKGQKGVKTDDKQSLYPTFYDTQIQSIPPGINEIMLGLQYPINDLANQGIYRTQTSFPGESYGPSVWVAEGQDLLPDGGYPGYKDPYDIFLNKDPQYSIGRTLDNVNVIGNKKRAELKNRLKNMNMGWRTLDEYTDKEIEDFLNTDDDFKLYLNLNKQSRTTNPTFGDYKDKDNWVMNSVRNEIVPKLLKEFNGMITNDDVNEILNVWEEKAPYYGDPEYFKDYRDANAYNSRGSRVTINPWLKSSNNMLERTVLHELEHAIRQDILSRIFNRKQNIVERIFGIPHTETVYLPSPRSKGRKRDTGYSKNEVDILSDAYRGMKGFNYSEEASIKENDFEALAEKGTTNAELRGNIKQDFQTKYQRDPTEQELNDYIDSIHYRVIIDKLRKGTNGYGEYMVRNYYDKLDENQLKDAVDRIRRALKEVAYLNNNLNKDYNLSYAKSGIKIKKKNRGKFTEYCGGNVTQECINRAKKSGNKTLIKRATFADNARKWNK